jgi:23S rRNA (adenine2503-C2)-methyltransferase
MTHFNRLASLEDQSVNFWRGTLDGGMEECRLVRRVGEKLICYLSSHSGCAYSCRFCHLTATGQTMMTPVSLAGYCEQAEAVMGEYDQKLARGEEASEYMHFNFMARGEALANPIVIHESGKLFEALSEIALRRNLSSKYLLSTIIPRDFNGSLSEILGHPRAHLYYSLYSMDPSFRKRWLPKAMDPHRALDLIADYQVKSGRPVALHWAFIAGQNDHEDQVDAVLRAVSERGIKAKFNLVRYNPHDHRHGQESSEQTIELLFSKISASLGEPGSRIVPRVGFDVKASCGMFLEDPEMTA